MSIFVETPTPFALLKKIKDGIENKSIRTWENTSGSDFTHKTTSQEWYEKAWMRAERTESGLIFGVIAPKGAVVSTRVYAVYQGRFAEMLLAHFDNDFTSITMTALASRHDIVKGQASVQ